MNWSNLSYIYRSRNSRKILELLEQKPHMTPIQVSKALKLDKANVSHNIVDLAQRGLIKCENPEDRKFRFYRITEQGKQTIEEARKQDE